MKISITIKQEYRLYVRSPFSETIGDFLEIKMIMQNSTIEIVSARALRALCLSHFAGKLLNRLVLSWGLSMNRN